MRDLFILLVLPFLLYAMLKRPFIALGLWVWTAMFFPNYWVYGSAGVIRFNLLFSIGTVLALIFYKKKEQTKTQLQGTGWLVVLFLLWSLISAIFTVSLFDLSIEYWTRFLKVILLFIFILLIVRDKIHFDFFLWCLVISIGAYGGFEGLKYVLTGGGHSIKGMSGHVLGDRNELAIAMVMLIPICIYFLRSSYAKEVKLIKVAFLGLTLLIILSILGTNSRGGLISLVFLAGYFLTQSKNKILYIILSSLVCLIAFQFIPDDWFHRMNTIENANQDASFMGRVVAWKLSLMLALENPFFGGGMKSLEFWPVWSELSIQFHNGYLSWFSTGDAIPDTRAARAAHSIYFQVLGEQGFIGLIIFISILVGSYFRSVRIGKNKDAEPWERDLAQMLKLSLISYMLGGAALSFAYFDGIYAIIGLLIVLENKSNERKVI